MKDLIALFVLLLVVVFMATGCGGSSTQANKPATKEQAVKEEDYPKETPMGAYKLEPLPKDFRYDIIEHKADSALEKNQVYCRIPSKITEGQIATLAEHFYKALPKQRRFYMFYLLPNMEKGAGAYATSHFDPDLKIVIYESK